MSNAKTLKRNVERFFQKKGYDYGYDPEEIGEFLSDLIYEELYDAVLNQQRSVFERLEFEPYGDEINVCVQDKCIFDGTLLTRMMAYENENDDYAGLASRRYLELWINEDMEFQVVSCFESTRDYGGYVSQYREVQNRVWPDDEVSLEIEDLIMTLSDMCWNISGYDAMPMFDAWE